MRIAFLDSATSLTLSPSVDDAILYFLLGTLGLIASAIYARVPLRSLPQNPLAWHFWILFHAGRTDAPAFKVIIVGCGVSVCCFVAAIVCFIVVFVES